MLQVFFFCFPELEWLEVGMGRYEIYVHWEVANTKLGVLVHPKHGYFLFMTSQ